MGEGGNEGEALLYLSLQFVCGFNCDSSRVSRRKLGSVDSSRVFSAGKRLEGSTLNQSTVKTSVGRVTGGYKVCTPITIYICSAVRLIRRRPAKPMRVAGMDMQGPALHFHACLHTARHNVHSSLAPYFVNSTLTREEGSSWLSAVLTGQLYIALDA